MMFSSSRPEGIISRLRLSMTRLMQFSTTAMVTAISATSRMTPIFFWIMARKMGPISMMPASYLTLICIAGEIRDARQAG